MGDESISRLGERRTRRRGTARSALETGPTTTGSTELPVSDETRESGHVHDEATPATGHASAMTAPAGPSRTAPVAVSPGEAPNGAPGATLRGTQQGSSSWLTDNGAAQAWATTVRQGTPIVVAVAEPERRYSRTAYLTDPDHAYAVGRRGVTWKNAGMWVGHRPLRDGETSPGDVLTFQTIPTQGQPAPILAVHGQVEPDGWVRVLVTTQPTGTDTATASLRQTPIVHSSGCGTSLEDRAGQVLASLTAAAGHGRDPAHRFRAAVKAGADQQLARLLDWSAEWTLSADDLPSILFRLLGLTATGDATALETDPPDPVNLLDLLTDDEQPRPSPRIRETSRPRHTAAP